jgi:outer membrane lipoprotein-sorting protein
VAKTIERHERIWPARAVPDQIEASDRELPQASGSGALAASVRFHPSGTRPWAIACVIAVPLLLAPPAFAQWNPFKPNFGRTPEQPAPVEAPQAAPAPPAGRPAAPKPVAPKPAAAKPVATNPDVTRPVVTKAPLPPRRPTDLGAPATRTAEEAPAAPAAAATPVAAAAPTKVAAAAEAANAIPTTPAAALARVNAYLNSYDAIQADFVQHNPNGQKAEGSLYVKRPGQLMFKYEPPSTLEVVADGRSVAVRDKRLGTNDVYSIGQTPLKFLLRERVDLASDTKLLNVATDAAGIVRVTVEDSSTLGGTSRLTLIFDSKANQLKQWNIVDAQGYRTTVALYNVRMNRR